MEELLKRLSTLWLEGGRSVVNVIDILLVAYLIWRLLKLVRGTRAWRILIGVLIFVGALVGSEMLGLRTLHWLLDKAALLGPVALVILFLPELRQTIEGFAKFGGIGDRLVGSYIRTDSDALTEIGDAAFELGKTKTGALIVIEGNTALDEVITSGVPMNSEITSALLQTVFQTGSPLHDGAVVIRNDRIAAAACTLPLSANPAIQAVYHMRHRAGVGITEQSDALVIVVSEERGAVSLAKAGSLTTMSSPEALREALVEHLVQPEEDGVRRRSLFRKAKPKENTP